MISYTRLCNKISVSVGVCTQKRVCVNYLVIFAYESVNKLLLEWWKVCGVSKTSKIAPVAYEQSTHCPVWRVRNHVTSLDHNQHLSFIYIYDYCYVPVSVFQTPEVSSSKPESLKSDPVMITSDESCVYSCHAETKQLSQQWKNLQSPRYIRSGAKPLASWQMFLWQR